MKAVRKINHVTFAVKDLETALYFYLNGLGLTLRKKWDRGAYLTTGTDWICLSVDYEARDIPHPDYTHVAFDVFADDFDDVKNQCLALGARQWKENTSEGQSFYFLDPDAHKLEIHVGTLDTRLTYMESKK